MEKRRQTGWGLKGQLSGEFPGWSVCLFCLLYILAWVLEQSATRKMPTSPSRNKTKQKNHKNQALKKAHSGTSLVVQWLRLCTPNAGGPGSIPGQGTRSHMPQLKILHDTTKISHVATKIPSAITKTQRS